MSMESVIRAGFRKGGRSPRGGGGTLVHFRNRLVNSTSTTRAQCVAAYRWRDSVLPCSGRLCISVQVKSRSDRRYSPRPNIPNPNRRIFLFGPCVQRPLNDILAPNSVVTKICESLPSGKIVSVSGNGNFVGTAGSVDLVTNATTGEVTGFFSPGYFAGPTTAGASLTGGYTFGDAGQEMREMRDIHDRGALRGRGFAGTDGISPNVN